MEKQYKLYIYPTYKAELDNVGNIYLKEFKEAFQNYSVFHYINRLYAIRVLGLFFNLDADIFIIHWVDRLPNNRFGKIQCPIFLLFIQICCLFKKKIVWVLHNKQSHLLNGGKWVDYLYKFMSKHSDLVITHSEEGVRFFNERYPSQKGKCKYIPHPVYSTTLYPSTSTEYDYIIWGGVTRRKNVVEFLKYWNETKFFKDKRLLICGSCSDASLTKEINDLLTENICFINKFLTDEELRYYISRSTNILMTYNPASVLSSGALIYSLNFCKPIIAPHVGSFADLSDIVSTYQSFSDIPNIKVKNNAEACKRYIVENTWQSFPEKMIKVGEKMIF